MNMSDEEQGSLSARRGRASSLGAPLWACALAELVGTALLVALSCLASCAAPNASALHRALAAGLVITMLVQCFEHISCALLNPAVTLVAVVRGRVRWGAGAVLAAAQAAGGALGPALLVLLAPPRPAAPASYCLTLPADDLPLYKAVAIEAVITGCLALMNCASWDPRNRLLVDSWPLRLGLSITLFTLLAGNLTGASMNPARSLGPALWSGNFKHHWVYWAGPLGGAGLAALGYARAWRAPHDAPPRAAPPAPQLLAHKPPPA